MLRALRLFRRRKVSSRRQSLCALFRIIPIVKFDDTHSRRDENAAFSASGPLLWDVIINKSSLQQSMHQCLSLGLFSAKAPLGHCRRRRRLIFTGSIFMAFFVVCRIHSALAQEKSNVGPEISHSHYEEKKSIFTSQFFLII